MPGRKRKKKRIRTPILILILVVGIFVSLGVFIKFEFQITEINISESNTYSYEELYNYIFENRNDQNTLLFQYTNSKNLEPEIPFVSKVEIEIDWPHILNITVYEKSVVGYVKYKGCNMYFDKDGMIVESSIDAYKDTSLVTGLDYNNIVLYNTLEVENPEVFSSIHNLTQYLDKYNIRVNEIHIEEDGAIDLVIDQVTVLLGSDDTYMGDKIYELSCMIMELQGLDGILQMEEYQGDDAYITFKSYE